MLSVWGKLATQTTTSASGRASSSLRIRPPPSSCCRSSKGWGWRATNKSSLTPVRWLSQRHTALPISPVAPMTATRAWLRSIPSLGALVSTWRQITQAVWVFPVVNRSHSKVVERICCSLSRLKFSKMIEVNPPKAVISIPFFWASSMALSTLRRAVLNRLSISGTKQESMYAPSMVLPVALVT